MLSPHDLKTTRERLGLGQAALARHLGMTPLTVWRWEHGKVPVPPWLPLALRGLATATR